MRDQDQILVERVTILLRRMGSYCTDVKVLFCDLGASCFLLRKRRGMWIHKDVELNGGSGSVRSFRREQALWRNRGGLQSHHFGVLLLEDTRDLKNNLKRKKPWWSQEEICTQRGLEEYVQNMFRYKEDRTVDVRKCISTNSV